MIISGSSFFGSGGPSSYPSVRIEARAGASGLAVPRVEGLSLEGFARRVLDVRGSVGVLRRASKTRQLFELSQLLVGSTAKLGLDPTKTPTSLSSTREINALTTAYSGGKKSFSGSSTAGALVGGIYDGDQGTDTLTFTVNKSGLVGSTKLQLIVTDGAGKKIQTVTYNKNAPAGTAVQLRNGLTVALTGGLAVAGDSFQVDVFDSAPQAVDPQAAFNSSPGPNFEPGQAVGAGSFQVNGVTIDVLASDSIASVLKKINQADAGVRAQYDQTAEKVVLLADARGPGGSITVGADSSGFLDATKLSQAQVVPGVPSDLDRVLSSVPQLAGIASGDFTVNGQVMQVDTSVDSLQDVLDRITTNKQAGVVAYYDADTDTVELRPKTPGGTLSIEDGSSGLFSALGVAAGAHGAPQRGGRAFADPARVRATLQGLAAALQPLFSGAFGSGAATQSQLAGMDLKSAVGEVFADLFDADPGGDRFRSGLGIDFLFDDPSGDVVQIDAERLSRTLRKEPEALIELFFSEAGGKERGLFEALDQALGKISERLMAYVDPQGGLLLDLQA